MPTRSRYEIDLLESLRGKPLDDDTTDTALLAAIHDRLLTLVSQTATFNRIEQKLDELSALLSGVISGDRLQVRGTGVGASEIQIYSETIGNNTDTDFTIVHALQSTDICITVRESVVPGKVFVAADVRVIDSNTIEISFQDAPQSGSFRVTIIG